MAKIYGTPIMAGGAGGQNLTLPPMVTNLAAKGSNATITVSWTNPESDALSGVAVVYNSTHTPDKPSDGTKVDAGLSETASLTGLENGTLYYIRVFPYNAKKQYQTLLNGATTSATPNIAPAQVTNFQVTGSGASPVLSWVNPTDDPLYHETVVIQKVGSAPTSLTDGTEIYRGTDETCTATGLKQSTDYYFAIFTVSSLGVYKQPVVKSYRFDFPEEPTSYSEIEQIKGDSREWEAPETGWFKFIGLAASGNGGITLGAYSGKTVQSSGGGGCGGIVVCVFALTKGETVSINASYDVVVAHNGETATANHGNNGGNASDNIPGNGGDGGNASGGNKENIPGTKGANGNNGSNAGYVYGGNGSTNTYDKYSTVGGNGKGHTPSGVVQPTNGTNACCVILRGNTNIASPSQVSALSLIPKNNSVEATWENSGDPVQTGTMLVYNTSHTPKSPSDGVAVDVPLAQPVTFALNSDSEELQEDSKKQSYTITGVPNDKPVFVALFPYDKDRKYGLAKQEVEIPREHSWYNKQQELEAEVESVKVQMTEYQEYYNTTKEVIE